MIFNPDQHYEEDRRVIMKCLLCGRRFEGTSEQHNDEDPRWCPPCWRANDEQEHIENRTPLHGAFIPPHLRQQ